MSRRRYISTEISLDATVNKLAVQYGDFAALLYTWMIPHAEDDATITGDPEEILFMVIPGRRDKDVNDVISALQGMSELGLINWNRSEKVIGFPVESFYKYQTYVKQEKRPTANITDDQRKTPKNAEEQRRSAQNAASFSLSPSLSLSKDISSTSVDDSDSIREVFDHYCETWKDVFPEGPKLTQGRRNKIKSRLKSYSVKDIKKACDNMHASPWHRGENPQCKKYGTIDFLIRSDEMIDNWLKEDGLPRGQPPNDGPFYRDLTEIARQRAQGGGP